MEYLDRERTYRLVRLAIVESKRYEQAANAADLDAALTALDGIDQYGNTDHEQLRDEIKRRFATGIRKGVDADNNATGWEVYTHADIEKAIDQGYAETVLTRRYRKIVNAVATLFTAQNQQFDFTNEDGAPAEEIGELVDDMRSDGRALQALIRADRLSVALGSSALYVRWHEGGPRYQAVPPQSVYAIFAEKVESNGTLRAVDTSDIDDATAIVIRLPDYTDNITGLSMSRFLAYFGRSEDNPDGRCVVYGCQSTSQWYDVPRVGEGRVIEEYEIGGSPANPLTWAQNKFGEELVPTEYPVCVFLGQESSADLGLLPNNGLALWRDTTELDIAYSRTLSAAVEGARGLLVVNDNSGSPLPTTMSGAVAGRGGMTISKVGHEAAGAAASALTVLDAVAGGISNAYSVPAYQMVHDGSKAPVSGYSLDVQNLPLMQKRRERISLNEHAVERMFWIERGLVAAHTGKETIPATVNQQWDPGDIDRPVDLTEKAANIKAAKEAGWIDYVGSVREWHNFATDQEAIEYIEQLEKRKALYPGPQSQPTGLRAFGAPPPRAPKQPLPQQQEGTDEDQADQGNGRDQEKRRPFEK